MNDQIFVPEKITIFITNQCNIRCKHCFVNPLLTKNDVMEYELFKDILCVANKWGVKNIKISGGEPFLFWNEIKHYLNSIKNDEITYCICTNAFWAKNNCETENIIKEMNNVGIKRIEISTDSYHQEFIPIENIIRCIKYAQQYNIKVIVTICGKKKEDELVTIYKVIKILNNKRDIHFQYVASFGAALNNSINNTISSNFFRNLRCTQVRQPVITCGGDVFACCGPSLVVEEGSKLYLGKFSSKDSDGLLNRLRTDNFLCELYEKGPFSMATEINKININQQQFSCLCDICVRL